VKAYQKAIVSEERCEPTYKELKPDIFKSPKHFVNCCEPTYKELKHAELVKLSEKLKRCEPTYKELKQWNIKHISRQTFPLRAYL